MSARRPERFVRAMLRKSEGPPRIHFAGIQFPRRVEDQRLRQNGLHDLLGESVGVFELFRADRRKTPLGTFRIVGYEGGLSAHRQGDPLVRKAFLDSLGNLGQSLSVKRLSSRFESNWPSCFPKYDPGLAQCPSFVYPQRSV